MLGCGIKKRLLLSYFFLLMMVMHYACVQSIAEPESEKIEILNTSIELDRFENELFFQVETNQNESQELIHSVAVELTYTGDNIHEYSETFQLHDNGENGDIIASNGIYTLLTTADMVVLPEIEPEIKKFLDSIPDVKEHEVIKGIIVSFSDREVLVDIGFKSEGVVPRVEFLNEIPEIGNEIDVYLVRLPMHPEMQKIEELLMKNFEERISKIIPMTKGYLDFTKNNGDYIYTDGNHLHKSSGILVSKKVGKWINILNH